jgi:hypothetical protein
MKKRIDASIDARIRRGALYVVVLLAVALLVFFRPAAQSTTSHPAAIREADTRMFGSTFLERPGNILQHK